MLPLLELNNLSVVTISKPSHYSESIEEMEQEMKRLKRVEARIIICLSDSAIAMSCWLHRFGLFGPEFVIIGSIWYEFEPDTAEIPDYISDLCNAEILSEMIQNWIFVGQGSNNELFGDSFTDSNGLNRKAFFNQLDSLVVGASSKPHSDWALKCYDIALLMGTVIGEAERLIRLKLNTSIELLASDPKQSLILLSMIEETLFKVNVTGQKGNYKFEKATNGNTGGYVPVLFYQKIYNPYENKLERRAVGYMETFDEGVKDLNGGFVFRTKNGQPPQGYVKIIKYQRPILEPIEYWFYISIAILMIAILIGLNIANRIINPYRWTDNVLPSLGIVLILCHSFANPNNQSMDFTRNCSAILLFDMVGFVVFLFGLSQTSDRIAKELNITFEQQRRITMIELWFKIIPSLLATCGAVCMVISVSLGLFSQFVIAKRQYGTKEDKSIVYQPEYRFCSMKPISEASVDFFIAGLSMFLAFAFQLLYKSYENKMVKIFHSHHLFHELFCF